MKVRVKKTAAVLLSLLLLVTMMPAYGFAGIDGSRPAVYREGAVLYGGDGGTYQFPPSEQGYIPIWYVDTATGEEKVFEGQYESGEPKRTYVIQQDGQSYRGYCIEHGVRVDTSKNLTASDQADLIYAGLSAAERTNLQLALYYGYQSGGSMQDLMEQGFETSTYYGQNGTSYSWADWYMATQCLVWEIQQKNRSEAMVRQENALGVSGTHYFSMVRNRPAADIYNWMAAAIRAHLKFPAAVNGMDPDNPKIINITEDMKTADGFAFSFDDTTGLGSGLAALDREGNPAENVTIAYDAASAKYTLTVSGQPAPEGYTIVHGASGKNPERDLLFWGWQSGSSHVQTIVTGAADPVARYIAFSQKEEGTEPENGEKPEPEYFPVFVFPVSKQDLNPGWDGDVHTGMGDASLGASYVLLRNGVEVDRITLDEYGTGDVLCDQPWQTELDLTEVSSGTYVHTETTGEPPETVTHCTVEPMRTEWTGSVTYEIREVRPDGRFIEPDVLKGVRSYTADYKAVTENSQMCTDDPENWSEITYEVNYSTVSGTNAGSGTAAGVKDQLSSLLSYNEETFINDCYRGRIFLAKSNESEDVFDEEGSSGSQVKSTGSQWRIHLESGGWEGHPYIRFAEEGMDRSGTRLYRAVRDTSGVNNASETLKVGTNGCIYVADIPYGTYIVEEVKADDSSFVLESFRQFVGEHGNGYSPSDESGDNRYDWNLRNKKKENVIKVIKTDAETGKQVDLEGTRFYIRYMGNPLLQDPSASENYGRLLPNAPDINSTDKDYTFLCDENGEITLPYDLEFGTYRLEEWRVPEGYFVGEEQVNYYTFKVENQPGHMDGQVYTKYYQAVAMANNAVKGRISVEKEGEFLTDFIETVKNGFKVWTPQYTLQKLKGAVFGIFAAEDITLPDGNDGPVICDAVTGEVINIPMEESTHSGINMDGAIYEKGTLLHASGARLHSLRERDQAEDNRYMRVYTTPEQKQEFYSTSYDTEDLAAGTKVHYDVEVQMDYQAGGTNVTEVKLIKTTTAAISGGSGEDASDTAVDLAASASLPSGCVGDSVLSPLTNYESAAGNVLDVFSRQQQNTSGETAALIQEYAVTYTQLPGSEEGFRIMWDDVEITSTATLDNRAAAEIRTPQEVGALTAEEPEAPVYFLHSDGIRSEMYYYGGVTKTRLTIPMDAVDGNFEEVVPTVRYGLGNDSQIIDWFTDLSPDTPVYKKELQANVSLTAERHEGKTAGETSGETAGGTAGNKDVWYTVTLISDQQYPDSAANEMTAGQRPFTITYADGYTATVYCAQAEDGNGMGVMLLDGVDRTTRYALSDLVEIITTGEDGTAVSGNLPLGKYTVRELAAPEGFIADTRAAAEVELKYQDQLTPVIWQNICADNETFRVEIDLQKVFETGYRSGVYEAGGGAVFGLYNAEEILYGAKSLAPGTLLDVLTVDRYGRVLSESRLPAGAYYIKELQTRNGYEINETPFFFIAGDDVKSEPLYISRDADGTDADGMTVKAVMDGYGRATVAIEALRRYPEASLTVNGRPYSLGQSVTEGSVTIRTEQDLTAAFITVTAEHPVQMILPDGKLLTLTVDGNQYHYSYDGAEGVYVPEIAWTGYFAEYVMEDDAAEDDAAADNTAADEDRHTVILSAPGTVSQLTVKRTADRAGDQGTEEEDTQTDGNRTLFAEAELTEGSLLEAWLGETGLAPDVMGEQPVRIEAGQTLKMVTRTGEIYLAELGTDGAVSLSVSGAVKGSLTGTNQPELKINGTVPEEGLQICKSVTLARQDSAAKTVQIKINTADNLNAGPIENRAKDVPIAPYEPQDPPEKPEIPDEPVTPDEPQVPEEPEEPESPAEPHEPETPEVPEAPTGVPKTGNHSAPAFWMMLSGASLCMAAVLWHLLQKRNWI